VIKGLLLDSPFSSLWKISEEVAQSRKSFFLISPVIYLGLQTIRSIVNKKAGFDIKALDVVPSIESDHLIDIPLVFFHGDRDNFVKPHHSEILLSKCISKIKYMHLIKGSHNSFRTEDFHESASQFFWKHCLDTSKDITKPLSLFNRLRSGKVLRQHPLYLKRSVLLLQIVVF